MYLLLTAIYSFVYVIMSNLVGFENIVLVSLAGITAMLMKMDLEEK